MAYNVSTAAKKRAADRDTKLKMEQEKLLMSAVYYGYFLRIGTDLFNNYSTLGALPDLSAHNMRLQNILDRRYQSTQDLFDSQIRDELGEPDNVEDLKEQLEDALRIERMLDIKATSDAISNTTQNSMSRSLRDILAAAVAADIILTQRQIARQTKQKFLEESRGRLETIGISQTQFAAEGAKNTEAGTLQRLNANFPKAKVNLSKDKIEKTWVAVLDNRTRAAHAEADGQIVPFNEPYIVMGQKLMYPGDTSLGATTVNVINCRCSSVKSIHRTPVTSL